MREYAGFKKVEGTKREDGKTVTSSNIFPKTARRNGEILSDSAQKDEAITKLALWYGISAKEFSKYYSECLTYSSADIADYLYAISA